MTKKILFTVFLFVAASSMLLNIPAVSAQNQTVYAEKPQGDVWVEMAAMNSFRSSVSLAAVDSKIYAIGGTNTWNGGSLGTNEMYDPQTDTWTNKTGMPTHRSYFATAVYQNKIYCFGGLNGNFSNTEATWGKGCAANEVYDPATDTWETRTPMPTASWKLQASVINGTIYLVGGEPNGTLNQAYDPETDTWTTKAPITYSDTGQFPPIFTASGQAASTAVDGKIYWIGRVYSWQNANSKIVTVMYNPENDSWTPKEPPPSDSDPYLPVATTGIWAPKKIYVFDENCLTGIYDPATDTWMFKRYLVKNREDFGVAVLDDKLYVIGGGAFRYRIIGPMPGNLHIVLVGDNEQYTPADYGTVPPIITTSAPQNGTFTTTDKLVFTTNKPVTSMSYSLDRQTNVTVTGNLSLTEVALGTHNITVYAVDKYGNSGSESLTFTVELGTELWVWETVAAAVAVGGAALIVILRKKRRKP